MEPWPFEDPPDVAVIAVRQILDGSSWIAFVSRDADDGGWQFHTNEPGPPRVADAAIVGLGEIFHLDQSIRELADLPLGWCAWRESVHAPWQRSPIAPLN